MRSKRILIFTHASNYGSAGFFARHLEGSFVRRGYDVRILCLESTQDLVGLQNEIRHQPSFIIARNGIAFDAAQNGRYLLDLEDTPVIAYLVDHPFHHISRLAPKLEKAIYTCVDHSHVECLSLMLQKGERARFMSHFCLDIGLEQAAERDIDVLFPSSVPDSNQLYEYIRRQPPDQSGILMQMAEHGLSQNCRSLHDIAFDVLLALDPPDMPAVFSDLLPHLPAVDLYIRSRRRESVLEELASRGLAVDIFGRVAKGKGFRGHRVHDAVPIEQMPRLMARAKVVLHTGPLFVNGSHDRVFTAMSSGAAAVTDRTIFWQDNFEEGKEILTYTFPELSELAPSISRLLAGPDHLRRVAEAGRLKARRSFSSDAVASRILDLVADFYPESGIASG